MFMVPYSQVPSKYRVYASLIYLAYSRVRFGGYYFFVSYGRFMFYVGY